MICRYSLVRKEKLPSARRLRWQSILKEAAEQSGRGLIPELCDPQSFESALIQAKQEHDLCLVAYEAEQNCSLAEIIPTSPEKQPCKKIALFIGPEGGFACSEVMQMRQLGIKTFTLGKRILRMETAAIIAPALIFYACGEMQI